MPPAATEGCHAIGPLESAELADQLSALLLDGGFRVNHREASEQVPAGYSVQTPYQESREPVRELAARLREQGIRDMQIIGRDAHTWRLSLGFYRNKKLAELRQETLSALGVETALLERSRSRVSWWLDERRDIVASTYAACNYLSDLYDVWESWPLASVGSPPS